MIDDKQVESSDEGASEMPPVQIDTAQPVVNTADVDVAASAELAANVLAADVLPTEAVEEKTSVEAAGEVPQVGQENTSEAEKSEADKIEAERLEAERKTHIPWYVVHVYSGFEGRVKLSLEERIRNASLQDKFGRIIVPQEKVVELVRGEKKTSTRKFFPGYILIQCVLDDETWHLVKDTPKVTGFVGDSHNPVPLSPQEVQTLFEQMEGIGQKARPKVQFEDGDSVKVIDGPFADFNGTIDEVKADKGKVRVLISIFGRNTPVELDFVQVEKV